MAGHKVCKLLDVLGQLEGGYGDTGEHSSQPLGQAWHGAVHVAALGAVQVQGATLVVSIGMVGQGMSAGTPGVQLLVTKMLIHRLTLHYFIC
jgi:hypothetical protein